MIVPFEQTEKTNAATMELNLTTYLDKNHIKHPTALLHFERNLSNFEQGVMLLCIHIVNKTERDENNLYYLNKSLVRAVLKQENNADYAKISNALGVVSKTDLKFNFLGEDRTFDEYYAPLVIGRALNQKRGVLAFEVHPRLEQVMKQPNVFSRLNILFIARLSDLNRGYSFYALMKDFVDRTKAKTVTLDYWDFRRYLGVSDEKYRVFKSFKQWVLRPLINAVNERTDLKIKYEPEQTGRKLTHLKFTISPQSWQLPLFETDQVQKIIWELSKNLDHGVINTESIPPALPAESPTVRKLLDRATKLEISHDTVHRAIKAFSELDVEEIFEHADKQMAKKRSKGESFDEANYVATFLNKGIGRKSPEHRAKQEQARKKVAENKAKREAEKKAKARSEELKKQYHNHRIQRTLEIIETLSETDIEALNASLNQALPSMPVFGDIWKEIGCDFRKLDRRKKMHSAVFTCVCDRVIPKHGNPEDQDWKAFSASR